MTDTTLTMTWTLHLSDPLTEDEKRTTIGNLFEHIHHESKAERFLKSSRVESVKSGFAKVTRVIAPDGYGKAEQVPEGEVHRRIAEKKALQKATVLKFMRGGKER
jgi:hypothetical protein